MDIRNGSRFLSIRGGSIHNNGIALNTDGNGVAIGGIGDGSSNITLDGVDFFSNRSHNIEVSSTDTGALMSNVLVRNCLLHDGSAAGFKIDGGHAAIALRENQIYNNAEAGYYANSNAHGSSQGFAV